MNHVEAHRLRIQTQEGRRLLADALPDLMRRVLALQGKQYPGFGFHWSMMKTAGGLMHRVMNYDAPYDHEKLMVDEMVFEDLVDEVEVAERHVKEAEHVLPGM